MRMITFSVLKKCKFEYGFHQLQRTIVLSADSVIPKFDFNKLKGDPNLVEFRPSWKPDVEPELRAEVLRNMRILPDFVTEAEEASMLTEVEPQLKRMRYEYDHWDNAIEGYRETERIAWREENEAVLARVRAVFPPHAALLPHVHVLDLAAAGHIKPHVDAVRHLFCSRSLTHALLILRTKLFASEIQRVPAPTPFKLKHNSQELLHNRNSCGGGIDPGESYTGPINFQFCGDVIAGLCLLSSAVMRLTHKEHTDFALDALLQRRCLYIMSGVARYDFAHAVLGGAESEWRGGRVPRARRVAVICRQQPSKETDLQT